MTGEPQPDLEIHQPALFATFKRLYEEHAPLAFRLATPAAGSQRVTVTVQNSDDEEVGDEQGSGAAHEQPDQSLDLQQCHNQGCECRMPRLLVGNDIMAFLSSALAEDGQQCRSAITACCVTRVTCRPQVDRQDLDVADGAVDGTVDAHLEQVCAVIHTGFHLGVVFKTPRTRVGGSLGYQLLPCR